MCLAATLYTAPQLGHELFMDASLTLVEWRQRWQRGDYLPPAARRQATRGLISGVLKPGFWPRSRASEPPRQERSPASRAEAGLQDPRGVRGWVIRRFMSATPPGTLGTPSSMGQGGTWWMFPSASTTSARPVRAISSHPIP